MHRQENLRTFLILLTLLSPILIQSTLESNFSAISANQTSKFTIYAASMEPTLEVGDIANAAPFSNASEINARQDDGDIIIFHTYIPGYQDNLRPGYTDALIVHRAINKTLVGDVWCFTTKGDANPVQDFWRVPEYYVVGKVVALTRTFNVSAGGNKSYNVTVFSSTTLSHFSFNISQRALEFQTGSKLSISQTDAACNVTFPSDMLHEPYTLSLDNNQHSVQKAANSTHTSLYFTHDSAPHQISIKGSAELPFYLNPTTLAILGMIVIVVLIGAVLTLRIRKQGKNKTQIELKNGQ